MRIPLKNSFYLFVFIFSSFLYTGCGEIQSTLLLTLPLDGQEKPIRTVALKALNKNARQAEIPNPEKAADMYFLFEECTELQTLIQSGRYALQLSFETLELRKSGKENDGFADFSAAFLYTDDISDGRKVKKHAAPQYPVSAQIPQKAAFSLCIGFMGDGVRPEHICGLRVHAQTPIKLTSASITNLRYGWLKNGSELWYGLSASGGRIPAEMFLAEKIPLKTDMPRMSRFIPQETGGRDTLIFHFDESTPVDLHTREQPRISFLCGNQTVSVCRVPDRHRFTLDGELFDGETVCIDLSREYAGLSGITMDYCELDPLSPITADTGLILHWPQEKWRDPDFEFFSWEHFPSVIVFDFADYAVQDSFLKRLAFFAEKKGFTGTVHPDEHIQHLHAFNAHDYKAETLAEFFQAAAEAAFPLNESEQHLQKILLHNGIIVASGSGFNAGTGAIVSLSRQSTQALRLLFITHECLHGIYFTEETFRTLVDEVFTQTDPRAILFLRRYFEVNQTLNYNTDDPYLLKNEFMAYILQQPRSHVQWYFVNRLSRQRLIAAAEPELCGYIREIHAVPFKNAADIMDTFLYEKWGLRGGRVHLAEINAQK